MAKKMTMHQELEILRAEVETLKKQEIQKEKEEKAEALKEEKANEAVIEETQEKAKELMDTVDAGKMDAKDALNSLLETIKHDYENLSPTSAIVLFALGAAFGSALSSK